MPVQNSNLHDKKVDISDLESIYQDKCLDLIKMRIRCSQYRQALEYCLEYLKETGDIPHPATNITHLSEKTVWDRIRVKRSGL